MRLNSRTEKSRANFECGEFWKHLESGFRNLLGQICATDILEEEPQFSGSLHSWHALLKVPAESIVTISY